MFSLNKTDDTRQLGLLGTKESVRGQNQTKPPGDFMRNHNNQVTLFWAALFFTLTILPVSTQFASAGDITGWELESEYNSYYDYKEADKLKGILVKFKNVTPLAGMAPGTAFILQEGDEKILVHLCPQSFANAKQTGLRRGVKTKVKGSWAFINGQDIFMASKAKQGEHFQFKVRLTKDGTPFWTMSAEQLAYERASE